MTGTPRKTLGNRIAPPRFLLFGLIMLVAVPVAASRIELRHALLGAFDLAAVITLLSAIPLVRVRDIDTIRRHALENDANRILLLVLTALMGLVILITIGSLLRDRQAVAPGMVALVISTLAMTWLFANAIFAYHYTHLYYLPGPDGDRRGLDFPGTGEPDHWDFLYFSFTLGMTFQTSDVTITGHHMRKIVLLQSLVAFAFNIGILAFVINILGAAEFLSEGWTPPRLPA